MEYNKDKRTKNLTLRDIHVGDWVQVWSETTERYSPPLKIIQICDDGTIYLVTSDDERPTPWKEDIKNVDELPITPELIKGFGFELKHVKGITKNYEIVLYKGNKIGILEYVFNSYQLRTGPYSVWWTFTEFFSKLCDNLQITISNEKDLRND